MKKLLLTLCSVLMLALNVQAADLSIMHPYARATPPNAPSSAVFLHIMNKGEKDISIVSASTPAAKIAELHTHIMEGDLMKMRQVEVIDIPANSSVELKPGGLHIMLFELQQEFSAGKSIEVTLNYSDDTSQTIDAEIKKVMQGMKHKH